MSEPRLTFISSAAFKIEEFKFHFPRIEILDIPNLPEPQSLNPKEIIRAKLLAARDCLTKSGKMKNRIILVDDVALSFDKTNGFPGPLVKWMIQAAGADGIYKYAVSTGSRRATLSSYIGICGGDIEPTFFEGVLEGSFVSPRKAQPHGREIDQIFISDGEQGRTLSELSFEKKCAVNHRSLAITKIREFLKLEAAVC